MMKQGVSEVHIDKHFDVQGCDNIHFDTKLGAQMAIRYLYEKGHRRIAFVSNQLSRWTRKRTYEGYCEEVKRLGLPLDERLIFISEDIEEMEQGICETVGGKLAARFMDTNCDATAVFCMNDMMAFSLMQGLHRRGVRIPEDISVMGFDDIPHAASFIPALTTIHCPSYETGRLAALMLIDRMQNDANGSTGLPINMNLQPHLVERESVRDLNL